jgi:PKD repeat protein
MKRVHLAVALTTALLPFAVHAQFVQQGSKLVGSGATGAAFQGSAVAVSADGNTAVVGGYLDNNGAGGAWIFTRENGVWTQQGGELVGTGASGDASQGWSVAISGDGNTVLVGGPADDSGIGAAWVFGRSGTSWSQLGNKLVGSKADGHANQGTSVALSADGSVAAIGGPSDNTSVGAAWVFKRSGSTWSQDGGRLVGTGAVGTSRQGTSVALSGDGSTLVVGGPGDNNGSGATWVYTPSGSSWAQQGTKLVGTVPTTALTLTSDASVTANFTQQPPACYTLSTGVSPLKAGTVAINTPQNCTGGYLPGTQVSLTIEATVGWVFLNWNGEAGSFTRGQQPFEWNFAISGDATVTADFVKISSTCGTLTTTADPVTGGTVSVLTGQNCSGGYTEGFQIWLKATPNSGWQFSGWSADSGSFADPTAPTTTYAISGSPIVTAHFAPSSTTCDALSTSVTPAGSGSVSVATPQNCTAGFTGGTNVVLSAQPAAGWTFAGWSGSGGSFSNPTGVRRDTGEGWSVALSNDGNTLAVGGVASAAVPAAVWMFTRAGTTWLQQGNPLVPTATFGLAQQRWSVALSGDGTTLLLAEPGDAGGRGAGWVFSHATGAWALVGDKLVGGGGVGATEQGYSAALSSDGNTAVFGGPGDSAGAGGGWVFVDAGTSPTCSFALAPQSRAFAPSGGQTVIGVTVTSGTDCPWVAVSDSPWITFSGPDNGHGNGQLTCVVAGNAGTTRSGTFTVAGQAVTLYQAGSDCSVQLDPASATFGVGGGSGSFTVTTTPPGCPWAANSGVPWLHLLGDPEALGDGTVSYTVEPNQSGARSTSIAVNSQSFAVAEEAYIPPLQAAFTFAPPIVAVGEVVQFTDRSAGAVSGWSWDFGDGTGSAVQSPAHVYADPGSYTVTLTVTDGTGERSAASPITVGTGSIVWVPLVSHGPGLGGSEWRSDVGVLNPGTSDVTVEGVLHTPGGAVTGSVVVPAGGQVVVRDIVGVLGWQGTAALELISDQPVVVSSRTYDDTDNGTVGQDYPAFAVGSGLGSGESAWLPQLEEDGAYRSNISLTNTGGQTATVTVALFDGGGVELGSYEVTLAPGEWVQKTQPFYTVAGQTALEEGFAKVTVTSGEGVIAFASVIDSLTNDPTTVAMVPDSGVANGGSTWVPLVSHGPGLGGSEWRSDVGVLNPGTSDVTVEGVLHTPGGAVTGSVVVPAGGQVVVRDIVGVLGWQGTAALELISDQPVVVSSRTYDDTDNGTVGQDYPAFAVGSGLGSGESAWLPQLEEDGAYRSNISLTNTGGQTATVTVALFDGGGVELGSYEVTLAPGEWVQKTQPFYTVAGQTALEEGFAKVTVTSGEGVIAFASVIDNLTNDPTTVAMVR